MPDEESGYTVTLSEVHHDVLARFDRLEETVTRPLAQVLIRVQHLESRVTDELAQVPVRVTHLEEQGSRRFQMYGPWLGVVAALIVGILEFIK